VIFYYVALALALIGVVCIGAALAIHSSAALTGEEDALHDVGLFLSGIALLCVALAIFVITYIVRNAP
jgi:hypothetical protein